MTVEFWARRHHLIVINTTGVEKSLTWRLLVAQENGAGKCMLILPLVAMAQGFMQVTPTPINGGTLLPQPLSNAGSDDQVSQHYYH